MVTANDKLIYTLPLNDDGSPDLPWQFVNLPPPIFPPYILRFEIDGTSPICRFGKLWENCPVDGVSYDRRKFKEHHLKPNFNRPIAIDLPIESSGAFEFYFTYSRLPDFSPSGSSHEPEIISSPTFHFNVFPRIMLNGTQLPVESLSILSVISKFMGEFPKDFHRHFQGISKRGYNMVHFIPLMKRGDSNSPYSISDQLQFDNEIFPQGEKSIGDMVRMIEKRHGLLSLTDVVWNHTANNSPWLEDHPEAGYSPVTAPWLQAALELDVALSQFGTELAELGFPTDVKTTDELFRLIHGIREHVINGIELWTFYAIDVSTNTSNILETWMKNCDTIALQLTNGQSLKQKANYLRKHGLINGDRVLGRHDRRIDTTIGASLLCAVFGKYDPNAHDIFEVKNSLVELLDEVNLPLFQEFDRDVDEILDQLFARIKYLRLDDHGPKLGPINDRNPIIETYFTHLPLSERTNKHDPKALFLVNNGWVWNADAMKDHAGPQSRAYLLRQVISWGDCVKLRYGTCYEDNPWLWDYMSSYTRLMAKYFVGFRIDNCHSTSMDVAQFMLDEARKVRCDILVFAELFTGTEGDDYVFAKRLGLNALIREAMQAWSVGELSRLVHRHGGLPIGSFNQDLPRSTDQGNEGEYVSRVKYQGLPALFMDCTHDNDMPTQKRVARDTLPNAALVAICASAIGSVMGYDEIYPDHINIVSETRRYASVYSSCEGIPSETGPSGVGGIRRLLNQLHTMMAVEGYTEAHIHHDNELVTVHRVHPITRKGIFLVAHTAFPGCTDGGLSEAVRLTATKVKLTGAWALRVKDDEETKNKVRGEKNHMYGLPNLTVNVDDVRIEEVGNDTYIHTPDNFPAGAIAIFETWIPDNAGYSHARLDRLVTTGADEALGGADLIDLNLSLFRCAAEERDWTGGKDGVYEIWNYGHLVYAGLQGWWSVLGDIIRHNDLGHPLCDNIREGHWALNYIVNRLRRDIKDEGRTGLRGIKEWFDERFEVLKKVPSFLLPRYFAMTVQTAYYASCRRALAVVDQQCHHGHNHVRRANDFFKQLAMVSIQQVGLVKSASLWPDKLTPSLAAGLPHFSMDWTRCWGRDVMISLRGLLLVTGRYDVAKDHITAFASVLKHGMVPNLLNSGRNPRYNSRDSVWFLMQAIQDYMKMAPTSMENELLKERVRRRFLPYDDTWFPAEDKRAYSQVSSVEDIMQEVFQRHASGLSFREHNAGPDLDSQMTSEGFNIDVHVDWETGFIFGGNQWNCGTWQDKMGESTKAGNKGFPGTPRDGAAVEIIGLLYSALRWVEQLHLKGKYHYDGVKVGDDNGTTSTVTFKNWADKIKANFERCYYIPVSPSDDHFHDVDPGIVNRRGIYKDLYRTGKPYEDYQLRANFPIAMTVAADLFTPSNAIHAIYMADTHIRGPLGMATLDPNDYNYRPNYVNSDDSDDFATAKGRNYHQGPEWLWPMGYFLRSFLRFVGEGKDQHEMVEVFQQVTKRLRGCQEAMEKSEWKGLTELTNQNGAICYDSSPTQAWSAGCLLDLFYDSIKTQNFADE